MHFVILLLIGGASVVVTAQTQAFPCPVTSQLIDVDATAASPAAPALAGGYQLLQPNENNAADVLHFANVSFNQWLRQDDNETRCNASNVGEYSLDILSACTQVVAGTNTAVQYAAAFTCVLDDAEVIVIDRIVLDAVIYTPLPSGGNAEPQVTSVYLDPEAPEEEDLLIAVPDSPLAAPAIAPAVALQNAAPPDTVVTFTGDNSR